MTENAKTITIVLLGLLAIAVGLITAPSSAEVNEETLVGVNLTKAFDVPEAAKRLRIVRFDEDTATLREFEVAEHDGLWSIPSKDGYPADAAKQMAEAATSLMDRKVLQVASKNAGDHEQYGVIDPLSPKLVPGQKGVGTRVTMSDAQSKPLVDLILGKAVRDAEGQRYIREAGRDVVYIIEIDPAKLSTDFEDWIEKDLLKLNAWDLAQVEVKDYSAEMGVVMSPEGRPSIGVAWDPRADMTLAYSDADAKWSPVKLRKFDSKKGKDGEYVDFTLAEDEELNGETLNGLKSALDDLKIVDVKHKPQGLSENLKAGEDFMNNREALQDLITKGFAATATPEGGSQEIISSDGEVIATMKNGAEYVLRFGNLTNAAGEQDKQEKDEKAKETLATPAGDDKKSDKGDVHRYLFVMARFNEGAIKRPDLVKLPDLPAKPEAKPDAPAPGSPPAATPPAEGAPAAAPDAAKAPETPAATPPAPAKEGDPAAENKPDAAATPPAAPAEPVKETPAAATDAAKPAESAEKKDDAAAKDGAQPDKELEKVIAERQQIEQENQHKLDEYQALIKKGQESVKDLNLRFGDWYFVVNDDVFQKVRLSSDKVIKKKDKPKAEGEADPAQGGVPPGVGIPGLPSIPGAKP